MDSSNLETQIPVGGRRKYPEKTQGEPFKLHTGRILAGFESGRSRYGESANHCVIRRQYVAQRSSLKWTGSSHNHIDPTVLTHHLTKLIKLSVPHAKTQVWTSK